MEKNVVVNRKTKGRRGRRGRAWKPYHKLTAEERKSREIYEERRAERTRALRFKHGFPVAPYNTTQFLFNDRMQTSRRDSGEASIDVDEIVEHIRCRARTRSDSFESLPPTSRGTQRKSDEMPAGVDTRSSTSSTSTTTAGGDDADYYSTSDVDEFLELEQRQFDAAYESAHNERLESMSKPDLIKDFLDMEKQLERIQRELAEKRRELDELTKQLDAKAPQQQQCAVAIVGLS